MLDWQWERPIKARARDVLIAQARKEAVLARPGIMASIEYAVESGRPTQIPLHPTSQEVTVQHLLDNARRYQERHLPGYYNLPEEWRADWEKNGFYAATGSRDDFLRNYICLLRQARRLQQALEDQYEPSPQEVDAVVADFLKSYSFDPSTEAVPIPAPLDGKGVPDGHRWLGDTKNGRPLFLTEDGRLFVRDRRGDMMGYSGIPASSVVKYRPMPIQS